MSVWLKNRFGVVTQRAIIFGEHVYHWQILLTGTVAPPI